MDLPKTNWFRSPHYTLKWPHVPTTYFIPKVEQVTFHSSIEDFNYKLEELISGHIWV